MTLTPRQFDVAAAIRNHWIVNRKSPTYAYIGDLIGTNKITVYQHIQELIRKGILIHQKNKSDIRLAPGVKLPDERKLKFPIVGTVYLTNAIGGAR